MEKSLSCKQQDNVMLQIMKEDLALKRKSMTTDESNKSADANAMMKIADSMQMLSRAIMTGFNHLVAVNKSNQQPFPQQYQVQRNCNQFQPCNMDGGSFSYPESSYSGTSSASMVVKQAHGFRSISPYSDARLNGQFSRRYELALFEQYDML